MHKVHKYLKGNRLYRILSWTQTFYNIKVLSGFKTTENIKSKKYEYTHNKGTLASLSIANMTIAGLVLLPIRSALQKTIKWLS